MDAHKLAFIGLGVMGYPMAGHLAAAGHRVTVYNRTSEKAAKWIAQHPGKDGANRVAPTPAAAAADADIVMMCVGNDNDVRTVALGPDGALASMRAGSVLVALSTPPSPGGNPAPRTASSRSCAVAKVWCLPASRPSSPRTRAP